MTSRTSLLEAALEVARLTGEVAARYFARDLTIDVKADGSPVTRADREAEQAARTWLAEHFPDDGVTGEEYGETAPGAARRWFLDPIDGTRTFVRGVPLWGSMVGVVEHGVVVAGAITFPAVGESIGAARGAGCWWNGRRCHVSPLASLDRATALTTDARFAHDAVQRAAWESLAARVDVARTWGDCYGYLLVATGRAEIMTDGILNPWDAVPLVPILEEAGGVITDWHGGPAGFGTGAIATNAALAVAVRDVLIPTRDPGARS